MIDDQQAGARPHTGRRRNDATRAAILSAVLDLAAESGSAGFTMDELAIRAGVSKRTIYRWWSSRSAVLAEALANRAVTVVVQRDTGVLAEDLRAFVRTTYEAAGAAPVAAALKLIMAEGLGGGPAETVLRAFVHGRRAALLAVLDLGRPAARRTAGDVRPGTGRRRGVRHSLVPGAYRPPPAHRRRGRPGGRVDTALIPARLSRTAS